MTDAYTLHHGDDGRTEYLLTTWPDGTVELATRVSGQGRTWSPPTTLAPEASEVCS